MPSKIRLLCLTNVTLYFYLKYIQKSLQIIKPNNQKAKLFSREDGKLNKSKNPFQSVPIRIIRGKKKNNNPIRCV